MSKRKSWILTVFIIVVIVSIAIALVLFQKKDEKKNNDFADNNTTTETYATSFSLNLPENLQILVGTYANLKAGFVNVQPNSMINKLTYEITPKSSGVVNGLKLENNKITANALGAYTIKFKMPKSKSTYFTKTINVLVYEEENSSHIQQIKNEMTIGESKSISDMFAIAEDKTYRVITDNKLLYSGDTLTAQNVGECELSFAVIENFVEYIYKFTINIKDEPMYSIVLNNVSNGIVNINILDEETFSINYSIWNRDEEEVSQDIVATSSNENILIVERVAEPLIKIKALEKGEIMLTISLISDPTIKVEVRVIIN